MPFRSADIPVQVRYTVFPVRPGEMRSFCRFRVIGRVNPGTDRNPRCTPVLSSLRHTPRCADFINTCGHFSKVVTKSDSWKNIFKNFRVLRPSWEIATINRPVIAGQSDFVFPQERASRETLLLKDEDKTPKEQELHNGYATTKPIPAASPLKNMASLPGETIHHRLLRFIVPAVLVILVIPVFRYGIDTPGPAVTYSWGYQVILLARMRRSSSLLTWNGYVSYNKPPEYIIVEAFSAAERHPAGGFSRVPPDGSL